MSPSRAPAPTPFSWREIRRNRSDGIDVRAAGCWIVRNKLFGNRDDGIDVGSAPNVLLWGNTCRENKQNGIEVDAEGLVALGNRLFANKNDGVKVSLNASENTVDAGLQASIFFENKLRENVQAGFDGWSNLV